MDQRLFRDKAFVFEWLLLRHVHEYLDVDGRPIGEGRAKIYSHVETKFKTCPYSGSRYHHKKPMSVSALQSILPEWQKTLLLLSWLSQRYQAFHNRRVASYYDLALVAGTGVFLSDYITLRQNRPVQNHQMPVLVSGLYKVCLGFQHATFLAMMNDSFKTESDEKSLPDAKGFYHYLEEQLLLIGEEEVCGGSEEMISRAYELMKNDTPSIASIEQQLPQLLDMAIDWDAYDQFTFHASELWRKAILFVIQMPAFALTVQDNALPNQLTQRINSHLKTCFDALLSQQSGLAVEIGRFTFEESGHSLSQWLSVQQDFMAAMPAHSPATPEANSLAEIITQQLAKQFDLADHQALITTALKRALAQYEAFEQIVVQALNTHLDAIFTALGYTTAAHLKPQDLALICHKTMWHWLDINK